MAFKFSINVRPLYALKLGADGVLRLGKYSRKNKKPRFRNGKVSIVDPIWETAMKDLMELAKIGPG